MNTDLVSLPELPSDKSIANRKQLQSVELKYGANIYGMRIRLPELFHDFDPLRSGLMTESRFIRCIAGSLERGKGHHLTPEEVQIIVEEYRVPNSNMIKWREFVDNIDKVFGAQAFKVGEVPIQNVELPFRRPVSPKSLATLKEVLKRLKAYGQHHGTDPKSWFTDFDKHKKGWVNYNQFRRGMPQNLLSIDEEDLLLERYGDSHSETVNYFKLHTDVTRKPPRPALYETQLLHRFKNVPGDYPPIGTEEVLHTTVTTNEEPLDTIVEDKIKQFVYKNRLRLTEFFKDYDRHNSGVVTQSQFLTGIVLARLPVEESGLQVLVKKYATADGRANYRDMCIFTINNLEQNPLCDLKPPSREWLIQSSNPLEPSEEESFKKIIHRLHTLMKERRLLLSPFFKDYEKYLGNMGRVTKSHFSRLLTMMGLNLSEEDLHILFRKYSDEKDGRINYMEFIRNVDPETYNHFRQTHGKGDKTSSTSAQSKGNRKRQPDIKELMDKIQIYVVSKRVQISEFFRDFDKLRSYSIRKEDFVRGVHKIGQKLNDEDIDLICQHYKDELFGESHLESKPTFVHVQGTELTPFSNTLQNRLTPKEEEILARTMENFINHLRIQKDSVKPFFEDLDKVASGLGHVTKSQFRQCLTFMGYEVKEEEFEVLCKRWAKTPPLQKEEYNYINDVGTNICYFLFLKELENRVEMEERELNGKVMIKSLGLKKKLNLNTNSQPNTTEFDQLMMKIKMKAKSERIRVIDFMSDFDHLRHGKISPDEFKRACKVLFSDLTNVMYINLMIEQADLALLEKHFQGPQNTVRYVDFSDEVESVFTKKGLEKAPTEGLVDFNVYSNGWETDTMVNQLSPAKEIILQQVMKRLQERINQRRIDAFSYMEDYDFVKEGTITTNQFRSVLNRMNLGVSDQEFEVLAQFFASNHSMTRINYRNLAEYWGIEKSCGSLSM
ncbi:hypothetical protein HDV02_005158 [Globomyces sp. JEL0801]|nr:hypothetical protein HDV02_005158 [Globomyces sp. JEL0801]